MAYGNKRFTLFDRQRIQEHFDKYGKKNYTVLAKAMNRNHKSIFHEVRVWKKRFGDIPYNAQKAHEACGKLHKREDSEAIRYKLNGIFKAFEFLVTQIPESKENAKYIDLIFGNLVALGAGIGIRKIAILSTDEKEKITKYHRQGMTLWRIAIMLNRSRGTIYRFIQQLKKQSLEDIKKIELTQFLNN